jgi:preprotein translocase subunit SecD
MRHRAQLLLLALIVGVTAFSVAVVWPDDPDRYLPDFIPWPSGTGLKVGGLDREAMRLGLDLKGGTYVLLEAETSRLPPDADIDDAMEGAKRVIEDRVNRFGVAETEIQREGRTRLAVQMPGISPEEARDLIGKTAVLAFQEPQLDDVGNIVCEAEDGSEFSVLALQPNFVREAGVPACIGDEGQSGQVIWESATCRGDICGEQQDRALTGRLLRRNARVETNPLACGGAAPCVAIEFDGQGSIIFQDVTARLVGYPLGIFLDEELIGAPVVQQAIAGGQSQITGLDLGEARRLAIQLNAGRLPVDLTPIQETQVDATLGDETVRVSVQAGLIGIIAVMAFMVFYYRLPGVLAALALFIYASVLLMLLKLGIPVMAPAGFTITLAGIAAFVLSVGMAVDANILIFERLKEELRAGSGLAAAVEAGFDRAWTSIRDSNVATIITAIILWWFGEQW